MRELIAAYEKAEDLINIGAYQMGSNRTIDLAIAHHEEIMAFLKQETMKKLILRIRWNNFIKH